MPLHDWTRVDAGIFHSLHLTWIAAMVHRLNGGLLPKGYFALGDQVAIGGNPDVLAIHPPAPAHGANGDAAAGPSPGAALLTAPPRTRLVAQAQRDQYTPRQRRIVLRHVSDHRIVAMIEIVSSGNKSSTNAYRTLLDKSMAALHNGIHLLIVDPYPPTRRDPNGFHGALWEELTGEAYTCPADADRTVVAYEAGAVKTAYVEPMAVGQVFPNMPLFLSDEGYVELPVEETYRIAFGDIPEYYREILEEPIL